VAVLPARWRSYDAALPARRRAAAIERCVSRESVPKPLSPRRS